ncbi:benzoate/H(+) symporter BenE family transporter [Thermoleptolyngbya sp. C42_A2020_037]|uniref:benzoate/H(+) symporter BenE family transporter n=1 Tax=Thermoleptolyngbya sp. C42_A2020_037 TaxID=2747799 RepID=UPI0019F22AD2|nr:benzoate/H(+) symporter BenE family transporter [Thermoleptolyngbya sp. C42_A2020_037]MBF2085390.1 benzoate/H(+) symporter BenE family transporter [Thermoleptolyngbya sp. C42_A2020_037]
MVSRAIWQDVSVSAAIAGFVTVLVGFTSSAAIVFQAAQALEATPAEIGSWMGALGLGMGITSIGLSLRYRAPVATAWSTPGAAMLITTAAGVPMAEAIGAFLLSAVLLTIAGFSGWFERMIDRIPVPIASAMLAGVLFRFGLDLFVAMKTQFAITFAMFCTYLIFRRVLPRYAVVAALVLGMAIAAVQGLLQLDGIRLEFAQLIFTSPQFTWQSFIGVALPLFVVTMASQNVPGIAIMRASGYHTPISPLIGWTGAATLVLAPFGGYTLCLAAITAAICMGREAHEDPSRRYMAAVFAGLFYLLVGLFGATVGSVFAAFPTELVLAIAGLALLGTIGNGLATALSHEADREPALITFLVTVSGVALLGIGSAFWGLVAGALAIAIRQLSRQLFKVP